MKKVSFGNTSVPARRKRPGGEPHATAGKAPTLVRQSTSPVDSGKPGTVKPWNYGTGYLDRPLARNKAPSAPASDSPMDGFPYGDLG